ncbi:hypothetical protein ACEPAH_17 [Sanghuangporus vaninii]
MKSLFYTLTLVLPICFLVHTAYGSTSVEVPHSRLLKKRYNSKDNGWSPRSRLAQTLFLDQYTYCSGFSTVFGVFLRCVLPVPLNVIKVQKGMIHDVVWQNGGFDFYLGGADDFFHAILNKAEEIMLSYSVMFEDGFEFDMGGKLPGAFAVPGVVISSDFGYSVGCGLFYFPTGKWVTIAECMRLNSVGNTDGPNDLWIDGEQVIKIHGITLREDTNATIQGSHFQTFFGGSSGDWASPKTQKAWFADVSGAMIRT